MQDYSLDTNENGVLILGHVEIQEGAAKVGLGGDYSRTYLDLGLLSRIPAFREVKHGTTNPS